MKVSEAVRSINFKIGNLDDISGRAINSIVDNRIIVDELNSQLISYASITKGIEDIFSISISNNDAIIEQPPLALRSQGFKMGFVVNSAVIYPIDMRNQQEVFRNFPVSPVRGITNWLLPFNIGTKGYFSAYPLNSTNAKTCNLVKEVKKTDTTIEVDNTAGFLANFGRLTIGDEKIQYQYKDTTHFYGCERGLEQTEIENHTNNEVVYENNFWLFYSRKPVPIIMQDDNFISPEILKREIEVVEEHMEGIIKACAYEILIKIDPTRANIYKVDSQLLYEQYKNDIRKGYYTGRMGTGVRAPFETESGIPYSTNLKY